MMAARTNHMRLIYFSLSVATVLTAAVFIRIAPRSLRS